VFILKVVGIALVATVLVVVLREREPALAIQLNVVAGIILLWLVMSQVGPVIDLFERLASRAQLNLHYVNTLLRIIGIAYLSEFGAQICRDADASGLAAKVEMAGKITILLLSIPIVVAVVELMLKLLPEV